MIRKSKKLEHLRALYQRDSELHEEITQAVHDAFPIGAVASYDHGDHRRTVEIIGHSPYGASLKVRGVSGAEYWLHAYRFQS